MVGAADDGGVSGTGNAILYGAVEETCVVGGRIGIAGDALVAGGGVIAGLAVERTGIAGVIAGEIATSGAGEAVVGG